MRVALQVHGVHLAHDVGRRVDPLVAHLLAQRLVLARQLIGALDQHLILALQPEPLLQEIRPVRFVGELVAACI